MFDVLILFETYIHTEAGACGSRTNLNRILPTRDLIEKISTMPCFGWKNLRIIRKDWQNQSLASDPLSMRVMPLRV